MKQDNHEKLYDILLTIKEDTGFLKADLTRVKDHLKELNGSVSPRKVNYTSASSFLDYKFIFK